MNANTIKRQHYKSDCMIVERFYNHRDGRMEQVAVPERIRLEYYIDPDKGRLIAERKGPVLQNCTISNDGMTLIVTLPLSKCYLGQGVLLCDKIEYIKDSRFAAGYKTIVTPGRTNIKLWNRVSDEDNSANYGELVLSTVFQGKSGKDGAGVPKGGKSGQVLTKRSDNDNDTEWKTIDNSDKMPKVDAVEGNVAVFDAEGNVVDSGKSVEDLGNNKVFTQGSVAGSAVQQIGTDEVSNEAISQTSIAVGVATKAGLRGWYYDHVNIANKQVFLAREQPSVLTKTSTLYPDSAFVDTNLTSGYAVGDTLSIVFNKKFENFATITAIQGNKLTLSDVPFTDDDFILGACKILPTTPDEFTAYSVIRNLNSSTNEMSIENYNVGDVDMGQGAHAEGVNSAAVNIGAHAEGIQTLADGQGAHTEGMMTQAGYAAHAEGWSTTARGYHAHAEGNQTVASGQDSHSEGKECVASGIQAHAEGQWTEASGAQSHAEGESTVASGNQSHAQGWQTIASGNNSHAEGESTVASGKNAHAQGSGSEALGDNAMAIGTSCKASGKYSFAGGIGSEASGHGAFAYGGECRANNNRAIAIGYQCIADGFQCTAIGRNLHASNNDEFTCGKFNKTETGILFSVGNGSSVDNRSNAFEVYKDKVVALGEKIVTTKDLMEYMLCETFYAEIKKLAPATGDAYKPFLVGAPTLGGHAATKQYVDNVVTKGSNTIPTVTTFEDLDHLQVESIVAGGITAIDLIEGEIIDESFDETGRQRFYVRGIDFGYYYSNFEPHEITIVVSTINKDGSETKYRLGLADAWEIMGITKL